MKKALTLVETMVATCIASMLLLELGSTFLMFRLMNNESISDTKTDVQILEVEDYIVSNADDFIDKQLGRSYFRVNTKDVSGGSYGLQFNDNGTCSLIKGAGDINVEVIDIEDEFNPNDDSVISFTLPSNYHDQPIYLNSVYVDKLDPANTAYYYEKDSGGSIDNSEYDDVLLSYEKGKLIKRDENEVVFSGLPYEAMSIKFSWEEAGPYTIVAVSNEKETNSGSEDEEIDLELDIIDDLEDEDLSYALLPFTVDVNNPDYGMVTIENVNFEEHTCTIVAHSFVAQGDIEDLEEDEEDEEEDEEAEEHREEEIEEKEHVLMYEFNGWDDGSTEFSRDIDYLNYEGKTFVANFGPEDEDTDDENAGTVDITEMDDVTSENCNKDKAGKYKHYVTDDIYKHINVTKKIYTLKCTIGYGKESVLYSTYDDETFERMVPHLSFVVGVYEKYLPEIYRGEN